MITQEKIFSYNYVIEDKEDFELSENDFSMLLNNKNENTIN